MSEIMYFREEIFMMVTVLLIVGTLFMLAGIAGCILPLLPGPPLCFLGLLIQQLNPDPPFNTHFLLIWGGVTIVITVLDYIIPLYGTKKFGGSKFGLWGCTIGLIAGLWFGPIGIIIGPFVGAFIGEIIANNDSSTALKSAFGSFMGFLLGTLLKLVVCFAMGWYFVQYMYRLVVA
jgi:uncharacterized protein YqgC (DUF456 family)